MTHLPSLNYAFRSAWDSSVDKALARIEELKVQGWTVNVERGALMKKQADLLANTAERMGCEVERIPVAEWGDDMAQFVAYKPKEPSAEAPVIILTPQEKKPSRVRTAPTVLTTPEQVMSTYIKEFFKPIRGVKQEPDPSEVQSGCILDPRRAVGLIRRDAQSTPGSLTEKARRSIPNSRFEEIDNTTKAQEALRWAKKLSPPKTRVDIAGNIVDIDNLVKALKVLGKGKVRAHAEKDGPVYVVNGQGDIVAIAPVIEAEPLETITYNAAMGLPKVVKILQ